MPSSSVADVFIEDILGTLRLKPWWEVCREYAFKLSLAVIALCAFFSILGGFNCMHYPGTNLERINLTVAEAQAVNPYCISRPIAFPWYILHSFGITVSIFIVSNFWLHTSGVTTGLSELSKFGHGVIELSMSEKEMENLSAFAVTTTSDHEQLQIRSYVQSLIRFKGVSNLSKWYAGRCVLVLMLSWIYGISLLAVSATSDHGTPQLVVTCEVSKAILNSSSFQCEDETLDISRRFEIIFGVTILLQSFAMCVALYNQREFLQAFLCDVERNRNNDQTPADNADPTATGQKAKFDSADLLHFLIMMMGIEKDDAKKIVTFTHYILFSDDFTTKLSIYSDKAIVAGDIQFFRILKYLLPSDAFWKEVEDKATKVLWNGNDILEYMRLDQQSPKAVDIDFAVCEFLDKLRSISVESKTEQIDQSRDQPNCSRQGNHQNEVGGFERADNVKYTRVNSEEISSCGEVLGRSQILKAKCNWHLLYICCMTTSFRVEPERIKDIKFDKLDQKGRSYLFYVLRKSSMDRELARFDHFNRLMRARADRSGPALVHFDGISMTAEDFFHSEYPEIFRGKIPDFRLCPECVPTEDHQNECADEYKTLCNAYCRESVGSVDPGPLERYFDEEGEFEYETFINDLNSMKLSTLSSSCKIAEKAIRDKKWEVLVALINTLIVIHNGRVRPEAHILTAGNENENDIFNLKSRDDLEEIFRETLRRPRNRMYFVPTAAEHVMSIMDLEFRKEMIKHVENAPLPTKAKEDLRDRAYAFNISNLSNFVEPLDSPSTSRATNMYASLDLRRMVC